MSESLYQRPITKIVDHDVEVVLEMDKSTYFYGKSDGHIASYLEGSEFLLNEVHAGNAKLNLYDVANILIGVEKQRFYVFLGWRPDDRIELRYDIGKDKVRIKVSCIVID